MPKQISFIDSDSKLIQQIEAFQKAQRLPSFTDAVRLLCKYGLNMRDIAKTLK